MTSFGDVIFLEVFRNLIDFFGSLHQDGWEERGDISRFNSLLTFVID